MSEFISQGECNKTQKAQNNYGCQIKHKIPS